MFGASLFLVPVAAVFGIILSYILKLYFAVEPAFLATVGFICYVTVLLFASHRPQLSRLDVQQKRGLRLSIVYLILASLSLTIFFKTVIDTPLSISIFFALALCATSMPKLRLPARVHEILTFESKYTSLAALVAPVLVIPFFGSIPVFSPVANNYIINIVLGIGVGIFIGVIFSKVLIRHEDSIVPLLVLLIAGFIAYALSERLGSFGPLAVAALGLFLAHAPRRVERKHENELYHMLIVFSVLAGGMLLSLPLTQELLILAALISGMFYASRAIATFATLQMLDLREKLMITVFSPVGAESIVLLVYFSTILLPAGITLSPLILLSQAAILVVFTTHIIAVLGAVLKVK